MSTQSLAPANAVAIPSNGSLAVAGLHGLGQEDLAIPYVRLVQPTSTDTSLMDGREAKAGQFLDTALRLAYTDLHFSILSVAKYEVVWQEKTEPQTVYLLLCADEELQPFVLKVSGTSIFGLKQLLTSVVRAGVAEAWAFKIRAVSEKRESNKDGQPRRWFAMRFYIEGTNDEPTIDLLQGMADELSDQMALPELEPIDEV